MNKLRERSLITKIKYNRPENGLDRTPECDALVRALSSGGDERITLRAETGLNKYHSAPYPRDVVVYSSSTVSDISGPAFAHLLALEAAKDRPNYSDQLDGLRRRIKTAYSLSTTSEIVFAGSGTDLEYVALASVHGRASGGILNILLGADEIGSGCIHSAHGRYFAEATALGIASTPREDVAGCCPISLVDVPVRCTEGVACSSAEIAQSLASEIELAKASDRHALVHIVHGSKTGLVLPDLTDLDELQARYGEHATFVVDACQARITSPAIAAYVERGCIVLLTGSKFMGAPPFNGFAVVPSAVAARAAPLPRGFAQIFNQAEFPESWPGVETLGEGVNHSLALRLEAAVFELERFQQIAPDRVEAMIAAFEAALQAQIIEPLGVKRVLPNFTSAEGAQLDLPIEMRTLVTLDVSMLPGLRTFDDAQALHKELAHDGVRLGQPVKCVRQDGGWGGTLRVGLSMPIMSAWAEMSAAEIERQLASDLGLVADKLRQKTLTFA